MTDKERAIFEGLNSEQHKAVSQIQGPVLIVAGAGSGKTRVLTCRIANILANGTPANRVLSLTFTKKAATEMKERVAGMVGARTARGIVMGTFHSVFIRFLRDYSEFLGYPHDFTIYDTSDSQALVKTCLKELNLDDKTYKPKNVLARISDAKNNLVTPAAYVANNTAIEHDRNAKMPRLAEVYDLYWRKTRQSGVMDFDDILFEMNRLLKDNREALEEISGRFDHILVDEYQDTNRAQYIILKKLAANHHNICVVGDDSQSIYAFRGARIENILNFRKDYPEAAVFRLEQNYRSTQTIVDAANSLIAHNENRIPKTCFSAAEKGDLIKVVKAYTDQEEAALTVGGIMEFIRRDSAQYKDFAILYRTNAQSRVLEDALRRRNIPYVIYSGNAFFDRAEVKDLMAYFKLVCNPLDDESFKRAVNKPARGIGDTSMAALAAAAYTKQLPLMQTALENDLENFGLKAAAVQKIRQFVEMIYKMSERVHTEDAYNMAMSVATESGLLGFFRSDSSLEGQARLANVEELCNSVKSYVEQREAEAYEEAQISSEASAEITVTLPEYLENIALLSAVDMEEGEDSTNKVAMMTVHSSKGLEFPYVFIVGLEENLFPGGGALARPSDIEEERRLFYVAVTRAKKAVRLSYSLTRMRNGETVNNPVSRFVTEIDPQYFENPIGDKQSRTEVFWQGVNNSAPKPLYGGTSRMPSSGQGNGSFGGGAFRSGGMSRADYRSATGSKMLTDNVAKPSPAAVAKPLTQKPELRVPDEDFEASPISELRVGQKVEHNRFGTGMILKITDDGKVKIDFEEFGEKLLLLKFAKIRIVR